MVSDMKVSYQNSMCYQVLERIRSIPGNAILRPDLADLGSRRQVSRALKKLIEMQEIVKLGYGIYGRLTRPLFNPTITYLEGGFLPTAREALTRLNVPWEPSQLEKDYNARRSTQVPANPSTKVNSRFCRKLTYKNMEFRTE